MDKSKIFKLSGIGEIGGKPQILSRINAKIGISLPEEDKILTLSLPINESGEVELPANIDSKATIVEARLETNQGEKLQNLEIDGFQVGSIDGINFPTFELSPDVINLIKPTAKVPNINWSRKGKFSVLGQGDYRFEEYKLFVYTVTEEKLAKIVETHNIEVDGTESWLHISDKIQTSLTQQQYRNGTIGFDGTFSIDLAVNKTSVGWVWVLTGPITVMGFREDDHELEKDSNIAIILPSDVVPNTITIDEEHEYSAKKPTAPPLDATEQQLIEHAELFSDDPGQFCQPFKNPERILGESRFSTILRVDQPEIAASAEILAKKRAERFGEAADDLLSGEISSITDSNLSDDIAIPTASEARRNLSAGNLSNVFSSPLAKEKRRKGRQVPSGLTLIDWEGGTTGNQSVSVARGHILEWSIRWRSNGYSLGNIAHTLTLAPRQIKRIMKVDFARRERAIRKERLQSSDEVDQSTDSSREYSNALSATLSEWSQGSSKSSSTGVSASAGFSMAGFGVSGGVSHGTSKSSSQGSGARDAASSEEQNVRDSIRQHGESIRALESTIVTEISQEESVEVVSEVVSNPNYCHSLSVVYYNILRHLRVDTELAGVSECLFVPFAITPFHETFNIKGRGEFKSPNLKRLIRYRDLFSRYLKKKRLKWVLRYLDDYKNNFEDVDGNPLIPKGKRSEQQLTSLRGVLSIKLDIRSPLDGDEDAKAHEAVEELNELADHVRRERLQANLASQFNQSFKPYAALLGKSLVDISAKLAALTPEEREIAFQNEVAPNIARAFCNNLKIRANGVDNGDLEADFTLDTHYKQGKTHKVYFNASKDKIKTISRESIIELLVKSGDYVLPLYSIANITSARISFSTEYYKDSASTGRVVDDLVEIPEDETAGATMRKGEATLPFPTTAWEEQDLRDSIKRDVFKLSEHIDSHLHYYHKAIWWSMDRDELYTLLDGYVISENNSRSIASVIERQPLAILGNTLVFRVARGATINNNEKSLEELFDDYSDKGRKSEPMRISLPTGGLYAQALKDECGACEEHYGNTDWVLERDEVMPQEIDAGLLSSRRAEPQNLTPTNLPDSIINIQNAPAAPAPSGTQGILNTVSNPNSFRDMTGLAGTQANVNAGMQNASALAAQAGSLATHSLLESKRIDATVAALARAKAKEDKGELPEGTDENLLDVFVESVDAAVDFVGDLFDFSEKNPDKDVTHRKNKATGDIEVEIKSNEKKSKPKSEPEVTTDQHVVQLTSNKVLLMNFKTGKDNLHSDHINVLNILAAKVKNAQMIKYVTGKASKLGSETDNLVLSQKRAQEAYEKLVSFSSDKNQFDPVNDPRQTSASGEHFPIRDQFPNHSGLDSIPGKGTKNDPVERSVLIELNEQIDIKDTRLRVNIDINLFVTLIGRLILLGNSFSDKKIAFDIDQSDNSVNVNSIDEDNTVINLDQSQQHTITNNKGKTYNVIPSNDNNSVIIGNTTTNNITNNITINYAGGRAVPGLDTASKTKDWNLTIRSPQLVSGQSIFDFVKAVINKAFANQRPDTEFRFFDDIFNIADGLDPIDFITDIAISKIPLGEFVKHFKFGTVVAEGKMQIQEKPSEFIEGEFRGFGMTVELIESASNNSPPAIILEKHYKTNSEMSLEDWAGKHDTLFYSDTAVRSALESVLSFVNDLTSQIAQFEAMGIPVDAALKMLEKVNQTLLITSGVTFKAKNGEIENYAAGSSGLNVRAIGIQRGRVEFIPK